MFAASRDRIGKSKSATPRRKAAFLGIFALLFQAALFGWHHHPFPLSSRGAPPVLAAGLGGHQTPLLMDDDCQLCFALSHHIASRVDFVPAPASAPVRLYLPAADAVWVPARFYVLFRSRAPPRA